MSKGVDNIATVYGLLTIVMDMVGRDEMGILLINQHGIHQKSYAAFMSSTAVFVQYVYYITSKITVCTDLIECE